MSIILVSPSTDWGYNDLKNNIASWLHRTDLTDQIPTFIKLAEGRMSADIISRAMESRTSLTTIAGNAYVTLPTDMVEMNRLIVQTDPVYTLQYRSADQLSTEYPTAMVSEPRVFAVIGGEIQLAPIPDAVYTIELTYQKRIPALSDSTPSNWLLSAYPNVYLFGALCAAQPFIVNDPRIQTFMSLYKESVDSINSIDWYSGSTMRVRAK